MRRFLSLGLMLVYLLGVRGGYVALWQDEDPEPVTVFPLCRGQPAAGGPGSPFSWNCHKKRRRFAVPVRGLFVIITEFHFPS